jgi:hypothetical protein
MVGKKIVAVGIKGGFPCFELDDGTVIEVSSDEEGNDGGFLFGLPRPKIECPVDLTKEEEK